MQSSNTLSQSAKLVASPLNLTPIALAAGVLLASMSTQLLATETIYRSNEGHTHSEDQLGNDLTPPLGINASAINTKRTSDNDNHLSISQEHFLWFGGDIWITDIGTLLYVDNDQDGYFSGFSITIDADTEYSQADVYATIDLQRSEGERERLHTTGTFSIYGNSLTDEYRVDIELVRNYPIADYDLFINLIDANDHAVVDSVGAYDISNLSRLPLESEELDDDPAPFEPAAPIQPSEVNNDIRVVEYSGAGSIWLLLALGIPSLVRRLRNPKINQKTTRIV